MNSILKFDSLWHDFHLATMRDGKYNSILDAAIGVVDGYITWVGKKVDLPAHQAEKVYSLNGGWVTPGLIDCHSHVVFGGNRADEFEQRLNGISYQEIAKNGGGIKASVSATRSSTHEELITLAETRIKSLISDGVTTLEIKSGYGLDLDNELKMLKVAEKLGQIYPLTVVKTCLAAHAVPEEFQGESDAYIDYICDQVLPSIAKSGLADSVDAFCETIAFSKEQTSKYFSKAAQLGLPIKIHAEQLSPMGSTSLAAQFNALSADHIEYIDEDDVKAMAQSGTSAVLLPGAFFTLKEKQNPPVDLLRQYGVDIAIATDCNPGTSPVLSLRLMMNMACTLFSLTPEEALAGVTVNAAKALGLQKTHGQIIEGQVADFVCWNIESPGELSYWMGGNLMKHRIKSGELTNV